jgi:hypothetical protein
LSKIESAKPPTAPPAGQSVEELIRELEKVRKQKVALEEREREIAERLRVQLQDQAEAQKLVRRLGSPDFADRESAEANLRGLGVSAKAAVVVGARSSDAEVTRRCQALLKQIRALERESLTAGRGPWPGPEGVRFKELVGDTPVARKLFAEMIADDRRADVIERAAASPADSARLYAAEVTRVSEAGDAVFAKFDGKLGDADEWVRFRDEFRRAVTPGDVCAVCFLGSIALPERADDPADVDHVLRASFIDLAGGPLKEPFRKLFVAWLECRKEPKAAKAGLYAALYTGIPDVVGVARRRVLDAKAPAVATGTALLVLGHHGTLDDLAALSALRDDDRRLSGFRNHTYTHWPPWRGAGPRTFPALLLTR